MESSITKIKGIEVLAAKAAMVRAAQEAAQVQFLGRLTAAQEAAKAAKMERLRALHKMKAGAGPQDEATLEVAALWLK